MIERIVFRLIFLVLLYKSSHWKTWMEVIKKDVTRLRGPFFVFATHFCFYSIIDLISIQTEIKDNYVLSYLIILTFDAFVTRSTFMHSCLQIGLTTLIILGSLYNIFHAISLSLDLISIIIRILACVVLIFQSRGYQTNYDQDPVHAFLREKVVF